jgi:serine/threonine protein kinase/tetratricopeptide (TPR) repeat protein
VTTFEDLRLSLADRYAIERELGRGGMATVYLARDLRHDRPVALKVLLPELASSLGPDRFLREIKLAARLQHPHILTVLDSGESGGGQLWFTMPYVEGESLRDRLKRERQLPLDDALRMTREAAQALEYAHQHGVVHRDIKPENLLLTRDGSTLVADFGIARAVDGGGDRLTQTGMSIGTPAYMSPEQAAGDPRLDPRTDIYSLGCVLYEMLAGEPPFTGTTVQALMAKRMSGDVPRVRQARPSVPEFVERAIVRALAPVAADRFPSAAEFARALAPASTMATPGTPPSGTAASATRVSAAESAPRRRRLPLALATMGLGFAVGLGVLFAWRHSHGGETPSGGAGARRVAVLPFENLGSAQDEYFADGVTDAVRGKLTGLPGLEVIASNSSSEYKKTSKTPQQIAQELGVQYLVVGKVRWEKNAGGQSRVQVSPELIQASNGTARWQQPFDAAITDVFQVQADIAGQVAEALNVALGAGERQALAEKPTRNLAAYDAYLKGQEVSLRLGDADVGKLRQAMGFYEQAVALDSGFVAAWAQLSRAHGIVFYNGSTTAGDGQASLAAAQRAEAVGPDAPETHLALGDYYNFVATDFARALEQYSAGLKRAPANAELLASAAIAEQSLGRTDSALVLFHRAATLDPRSAITTRRLARVLLWLRRYPEAREVSERGLTLAPGNLSILQNLAMVSLGQGDLAGARAVIRTATGAEPTGLVAFFANFWDLYWVLDDAQQGLLLRLTARPFDDNRSAWGISLAETYALRGDRVRTRAYADSARVGFEEGLKAAPNDAQSHTLYGVCLAYLGRKAEAIREGERGVALGPISKDAYGGPYNQLQLVRIYILVGEQDKALDLLEPLLKIPFYLSPGWLKIDPTFDPLRKNPRFQKLVAGTP